MHKHVKIYSFHAQTGATRWQLAYLGQQQLLKQKSSVLAVLQTTSAIPLIIIHSLRPQSAFKRGIPPLLFHILIGSMSFRQDHVTTNCFRFFTLALPLVRSQKGMRDIFLNLLVGVFKEKQNGFLVRVLITQNFGESVQPILFSFFHVRQCLVPASRYC